MLPFVTKILQLEFCVETKLMYIINCGIFKRSMFFTVSVTLYKLAVSKTLAGVSIEKYHVAIVINNKLHPLLSLAN